MKKQITIGALDSSSFFAANLALPVLPEIDAMSWLTDALDQAVTERKGVAITGVKGAGKSVALKQALDDFANSERVASDADATYERRRAILLQSPRSKIRRELLAVIWKAVFGIEPPRVRGRIKPEDIVFDELVELLLQQRVAVLAFDEAENLTDEALELIRDLISAAESKSKERYTGTDYRPAGVGALLVGDLTLEKRLIKSTEAGQRWIRVQTVHGLSAQGAAETYVRFLPGWKSHVEQIGKKEWTHFIRVNVARGSEVPVRTIENHVRNYVRRFAAEQEMIKTIEEVTFDEELFHYTLRELAQHRPGDDG